MRPLSPELDELWVYTRSCECDGVGCDAVVGLELASPVDLDGCGWGYLVNILTCDTV